MDINTVYDEALKVRNDLKVIMDFDINPIDTTLEPVRPFKRGGKIKLIIFGQDPKIKNRERK